MIHRERIKLVPNVPLNVIFEDLNGRECYSSHAGLEYRYNVERGGLPATLYLPAEGVKALKRAAPNLGDKVEIVRVVHDGQQVWGARILSDPRPSSPPAEQRRTALILAPKPAHSNGSAGGPPHTTEIPMPTRGTSGLLARCLTCAIDAAVAVESYASQKGKRLDFNEEDIRAMALTILINKFREVR